MSVLGGVIVAVVVAAVVAALGLLVYRPWKRSQRFVRGHEVESHVETDLRRMDIPAGVEAPWTFWIHGKPAPPARQLWGNADWMEWAYSHGGSDVGSSVIQVTIQGGGEGPVSIDPPELTNHRALERSTDGAVYGPEGLGGNGIHSRRFVFKLQGERFTREYIEDPDERPGSFGIAKGETQRVLVVVQATDDKRHVWTIDIPVIYAGRRQELRVRRPDGSLFTTYGGRGLSVRMLVDGPPWRGRLLQRRHDPVADQGRFPCSLVDRSTEEAPDSAPATSPGYLAASSPRPPHPPTDIPGSSPPP